MLGQVRSGQVRSGLRTISRSRQSFWIKIRAGACDRVRVNLRVRVKAVAKVMVRVRVGQELE